MVDTSVVFPHRMGPPFKRALRFLAADYLKRIIQNDGRDIRGARSSARYFLAELIIIISQRQWFWAEKASWRTGLFFYYLSLDSNFDEWFIKDYGTLVTWRVNYCTMYIFIYVFVCTLYNIYVYVYKIPMFLHIIFPARNLIEVSFFFSKMWTSIKINLGRLKPKTKLILFLK